MPRETAVEKGRRYIAEGRLTITMLDDDGSTAATCRGTGTRWLVTIDPDGYWACTCPARTVCAHIEALALVVDAPHGPRT